MLSREEIIKYITKCVDCAMPILQDENGLDVSRGYSFMLDKDKKAKVNIVFENRIQIVALKHLSGCFFRTKNEVTQCTDEYHHSTLTACFFNEIPIDYDQKGMIK